MIKHHANQLSCRSAWVDVRNVAQGHLRATQVEEASGQRFLIHCDVFAWQEWGKNISQR
jgi:hypothetical protein